MNVAQPIMWSPGVTLDDIERQVIERAFAFYQKNKTQTAYALGIAIRTLDTKLEKYEKERELEKIQNEQRKERDRLQLKRARGELPAEEFVVTTSQTSQQDTKESTENASSSSPRNGMESAAKPAQEYEMSMPRRSQVQELLPRQTAASGARRGRP